jgi:hypothetical protein
MASPTSRTLDRLRKNGYFAQVVERWQSFHSKAPGQEKAGVRVDLFGFIDCVAIRHDQPGVLAVQATSRSNQAARLNKILGIPEALTWLKAGNRLEVWGWRKMRSKKWEVTRTVVKREMFGKVATA